MTSILHHDRALVTLGSGSTGNATWIGDARRGVLVDCGISTKQILARLDAAGLGGARIDAVLLTHEHEDHVAAVGVLDRRLTGADGEPVPFYATRGTLEAIPPERRPRRVVVVEAGARVPFQGWTLEAWPVPHDTAEPVAWAVDADGVRLGVITDLGHPTRLVHQLLASLDVAVLEFNHDERMLLDGSYPWPLKQRIRGRHGHLSNRQSAELLAAAGGRVRHLLLAHLSEENNTPELALREAEQALAVLGRRARLTLDPGESDAGVAVAGPRSPVGPVRFAPRHPGPAPRDAAPSDPHPSGQVGLFDD